MKIREPRWGRGRVAPRPRPLSFPGAHLFRGRRYYLLPVQRAPFIARLTCAVHCRFYMHYTPSCNCVCITRTAALSAKGKKISAIVNAVSAHVRRRHIAPLSRLRMERGTLQKWDKSNGYQCSSRRRYCNGTINIKQRRTDR